MMEEPLEGPQMDLESYKGVRELLEDSPQWQPGFASELAFLCRQHLVVRSALMYALEMARPAELGLRNASTFEEMKFLQGIIRGLENYSQNLIMQMEEAEAAQKEEQDEYPQTEI